MPFLCANVAVASGDFKLPEHRPATPSMRAISAGGSNGPTTRSCN